jgi:hypothetical protein
MNNRQRITMAMAAGILLLLWRVWWPASPAQDKPPTPVPQASATGPALPALPPETAGLQLVSFYSGAAAMRDIVRLHNSNFPLAEGIIASYEGDAGEAILWISVSHNQEDADGLMSLMVEKMPDSPVFAEENVFTAADKTIYHVTGMGMEHYYWQDGIHIWWLATSVPQAEAVLQGFLQR